MKIFVKRKIKQIKVVNSYAPFEVGKPEENDPPLAYDLTFLFLHSMIYK